MRMLAALIASLAFTFTYATIAAKSRRAEVVLIPLLDVLQSVPVLGYLSFTVVFFVSLFPGTSLGPELAAIFAIFTSQAWNMAFSFFQALRTIPQDLDEAARSLRFSGWQRFWRLEVPFAMPGLIWNTMMSMSGGWFFVVASEAISVGNLQISFAGDRLLCGVRDRAARPEGRGMGHPRDDRHDPDLRSVFVSSPGRVG
jgi:NitT/TauT family transport system permease protein